MKVTYGLYYTKTNKFEPMTVEEISVCPLCHSGGHPHFEGGHMVANYEGTNGVHMFVILYCTICKQHYIAKYFGTAGNSKLEYALPSNPNPIVFDEIINDISPNFSNVYNQAKRAEEIGLNELSGIGYRKSLEFLIKDYLIQVQHEDEAQIKSMLLKKCIDKIEDKKLSALATGAVWLGNDETHYERRHPEYDIKHLKLFIKTVIHYIVGEDAYNKAVELINPAEQQDN